jgi:Raf kinase inhibitor-like YbhB/YbcL family protein
MQMTIPSFENGGVIPEQYTYGKIDVIEHMQLSANKNPLILWSDVPSKTQSLVLLCVDVNVPSVFDDANQAGKKISKTLPRIDFYHWVLVDIDPSLGEIEEGQDSDGVTPGGKAPGQQSYGITGINSYSGDKFHGGYDGPCPPWNDELMHHYHFRLYALDIKSLGLAGNFSGPEVLKAIDAHVIEMAEWRGIYTLNPDLRKN